MIALRSLREITIVNASASFMLIVCRINGKSSGGTVEGQELWKKASRFG